MTARTGFAAITTIACVTLAAFGQGGDTPATANVIGALPFSATGTTVNFTDDHDEVCPYTGSTSPDVFYAYTGSGELISIDLCNSMYDTKTYVYDSALALLSTVNGAPACNDDFCTSPNGGAFRSFLACVPAQRTVYVAVDGWLGDAGTYAIAIETLDPVDCAPPPPCPVFCPGGATMEPDDCAFGDPDPNDQVNGGCNAVPPAFTSISCDETVCGTGYFDGSFRDTDWWELDATGDAHPTVYRVTGGTQFNAIVARIDNDEGSCTGVFPLEDFVLPEGCTEFTFDTAVVDPGIIWFFVGCDFSQIVDCNQPKGGDPEEVGDTYWMHVECLPVLPPCPWDFDGDGAVGFQDLLKVLSNWGPCPT